MFFTFFLQTLIAKTKYILLKLSSESVMVSKEFHPYTWRSYFQSYSTTYIGTLAGVIELNNKWNFSGKVCLKIILNLPITCLLCMRLGKCLKGHSEPSQTSKIESFAKMLKAESR